MIADNDDWHVEFARRGRGVEGEPRPVPLAQTEPADARRQALKRDPLGGDDLVSACSTVHRRRLSRVAAALRQGGADERHESALLDERAHARKVRRKRSVAIPECGFASYPLQRRLQPG